jgi:dTDP-glucose pyrophosphorylase
MTHNWKKILVKPNITIKSLLSIIDKERLKLALVVDEGNTLLGTVSDGDIRRALINDQSLDTQIDQIMNTTPTTANVGTPRDEVLLMMESKELLSIPILQDGVIVGLELLHQIVQGNSYDNPVFLMAGGFGTRLKPLTDNCPKPLLKVGDKPILETTLLHFIKAGFSNFYISTHYLPEMIRDHFGNGENWGVSITYIHESDPLGTGGALGLLPSDLPALPIIVMNGDILTKVDFEKLLEFHNDNQSRATMCVREYEYQVPFGVVESEGYVIKSMVEKPVQRFHVNAGIYVISPELIRQVEKNKYLEMPTLFEQNLNKNVLIFPFHEYWLDIGRMDDFNRAQVDIETLNL